VPARPALSRGSGRGLAVGGEWLAVERVSRRVARKDRAAVLYTSPAALELNMRRLAAPARLVCLVGQKKVRGRPKNPTDPPYMC
jgi:hypothetical protein